MNQAGAIELNMPAMHPIEWWEQTGRVAAMGDVLLRLGVFLTEHGVRMRLGPLGVKSFDAARIKVRYPFELIDEDDNGGFEAFLPEEEQLRRFLPRMDHPNSPRPLDRIMLDYVSATEEDAARLLRPIIEGWHRRREDTSRTDA